MLSRRGLKQFKKELSIKVKYSIEEGGRGSRGQKNMTNMNLSSKFTEKAAQNEQMNDWLLHWLMLQVRDFQVERLSTWKSLTQDDSEADR